MKGKKCPYCGRRITYFTVFHEKKHGLYECTRCKKESKIKTDKRLLAAFAAVVLIVVLYIIMWMNSEFYNNLLGMLPAVILIVGFYFSTPLFIKFVPLKRFLDSEEDIIKNSSVSDDTKPQEKFVFDKKVFDEIKNKRHSMSSVEQRIDRIIEEEKYVPVIEDISEAHASSQAQLKRVNKPRAEKTEVFEEENVKPYVPQKSKPTGSKYTANRKF